MIDFDIILQSTPLSLSLISPSKIYAFFIYSMLPHNERPIRQLLYTFIQQTSVMNQETALQLSNYNFRRITGGIAGR